MIDIIAGIILLVISILLIFVPTMINSFAQLVHQMKLAFLIPIFAILFLSLTCLTTGTLLLSGAFTVIHF